MTKGVCALCRRVVAKGSMTRHLGKCMAEHAPEPSGEAKAVTLRHLEVASPHGSDYWLHLEMPPDGRLRHLDGFLRRIWLECCGHLSGFCEGRWGEELSDNARVDRLFKPGAKLWYCYDYGSSTELDVRYVAERKGLPLASPVALLARNLPPDIRCDCGQPATWVCTDCRWDAGGWLCDPCAGQHECGEDMLLPVTNSPRVGECGYAGERDDLALTPA